MEVMKYTESGIDERILRAVTELGFENMTPIQEQAIPVLLEGKDIIGQAQTGTGKTAAFGIPLLQRIDQDSRNLQAIILCPTRELAIQASEEIRKFAKYMHNVKMVPIYGGQDITRQIKALKSGVQIVVGTPGRVMDHMRRHTLKLSDVSMVVLDEADEMLNMGFREDMETILKEIPQNHQTALFSATMPKPILEITDTYQTDAVLVRVAAKELTVPLVKQFYFMIRNQYKEEAVSRLMEVHGLKRAIIFCNTKRMVDELAENLKKRGYQAEGLHGDLTQKQRDFVMGRFKSGTLEILIATDVAARGIDVDDVDAVFNYDIPQDIEYYVHRIGRTGRAGKEGMAFTFAFGRDMYRIREIERICKTKMTESKLPTAKEVMAVKAGKILTEAAGVTQGRNLDRLVDILETHLTQNGEDPMQFAAALLKMHMGEEVKDIVMEDAGRSTGRSNRSGGRYDDRSRQGDRTGSRYGDRTGSRSSDRPDARSSDKAGAKTGSRGGRCVSRDSDRKFGVREDGRNTKMAMGRNGEMYYKGDRGRRSSKSDAKRDGSKKED